MKKIKDDIILEMKQVMEEKDFSAGLMARLIGCDRSQVGRWLRGQSRPTLAYRKMIRRGLNRAKTL